MRGKPLSREDQNAVTNATRGRCIHCGGKCLGRCKSAEHDDHNVRPAITMKFSPPHAAASEIPSAPR